MVLNALKVRVRIDTDIDRTHIKDDKVQIIYKFSTIKMS